MSNSCGFVYSFLVFCLTVLYECLGLFVWKGSLCVWVWFSVYEKLYYECLQIFCFKHLRINLQILRFLSQSCVCRTALVLVTFLQSILFIFCKYSFNLSSILREDFFPCIVHTIKNVTFFSKTQINTKWEHTRCKA